MESHKYEDKYLHTVIKESSMEKKYLSQLQGKKESAIDSWRIESLSSQRMRSWPSKDPQPEKEYEIQNKLCLSWIHNAM